jgi:hypothetical protein
MKFSKSVLATLTVMSTLLLSGMSIPMATANQNQSGTCTATQSQSATCTFQSAGATFTGTASAFLIGPTLVSPPYPKIPDPTSPSNPVIPYLNGKPNLVDPPPSSTIPPTVNCNGFGFSFGASGCDSVSLSSDGVKSNPDAMNAVTSAPFTVEPPDQGLCVGNGYAMELMNLGQVQVYNSHSLKPVSGVISLDSIMGLTTKGWSSGGDIMCQYDYANGGHWFITQIVSASSESAGGTFNGCFAGVPDTCYEGIAVSVTSNPIGSYYVYFLNANTVNSDPGSDATNNCTSLGCFKGILLNDYAKTATTQDAFLLFYDEFPLNGGFNGAQEFAFSKSALEQGMSTVNVAYENMGFAPNLYPIPPNGVYQPSAITYPQWIQVIPAQTTDPSEYDNQNGGTGFMMASLDFIGAGDNRVAVFDWTGLSNLNSPGCSTCGGISFGGQLLTGLTTYQDEGYWCPASAYYTISSFCGLAAQKAGPIPLGDACSLKTSSNPELSFLPLSSIPCAEDGISTNGDGATQAFYAQGTLWTAVSTLVVQQFDHGSSEIHVGATYWGVDADNSYWDNSRSGVSFQISQQGIVSASHEDIEFPAVAAAENSVLMSFTLSGNGGPTAADHGGFYPSSAYVTLSEGWGGFGQNVIHVADLGQSPTDGFTQYLNYGADPFSGAFRPRWGDYGQAVFDSSTGKFFFASEYIQHPNCGDSAYLNDPTCGGTRAPMANWGSSINSISP